MLQVLLLELEPLRCWPTFRSKEHARTSRLDAVPDSVLRRPTGLKLLVARACANHASAAAAGVEWERRRTVLSLEVAWSTEYMRGSASICCYAGTRRLSGASLQLRYSPAGTAATKV